VRKYVQCLSPVSYLGAVQKCQQYKWREVMFFLLQRSWNAIAQSCLTFSSITGHSGDRMVCHSHFYLHWTPEYLQALCSAHVSSPHVTSNMSYDCIKFYQVWQIQKQDLTEASTEHK
jgi:hypothetical protein